MGADEDRALVGADPQTIEQGLALRVAVDVMPAERNQIALEQLADREGVTRRAGADQALESEALVLEPLPTRDHRAQ
jgi:hypothetical protein